MGQPSTGIQFGESGDTTAGSTTADSGISAQQLRILKISEEGQLGLNFMQFLPAARRPYPPQTKSDPQAANKGKEVLSRPGMIKTPVPPSTVTPGSAESPEESPRSSSPRISPGSEGEGVPPIVGDSHDPERGGGPAQPAPPTRPGAPSSAAPPQLRPALHVQTNLQPDLLANPDGPDPLNLASILPEVYTQARNFFTDAFRTFVVCQFPPSKIALGAIYLAFLFRVQRDEDFRRRLLGLFVGGAGTAPRKHGAGDARTEGPITELKDCIFELVSVLDDCTRREIGSVYLEIIAMVKVGATVRDGRSVYLEIIAMVKVGATVRDGRSVYLEIIAMVKVGRV